MPREDTLKSPLDPLCLSLWMLREGTGLHSVSLTMPLSGCPPALAERSSRRVLHTALKRDCGMHLAQVHRRIMGIPAFRFHRCLIFGFAVFFASYSILTVQCQIDCLARERFDHEKKLEFPQAETSSPACSHSTQAATGQEPANEPVPDNGDAHHDRCRECLSWFDRAPGKLHVPEATCGILSTFSHASSDTRPTLRFRRDIPPELSPPIYPILVSLRI